MKSRAKIRFWLAQAFVWSISIGAFGQSIYESSTSCGGLDAGPEPESETETKWEPSGMTCTYSSTSYVNYYSDQDNWIPTSTTADKEIHVNFIIYQNAGNSPAVNWQNTPAHLARLNQIAQWTDEFYDLWSNAPSDPIDGIPDLEDRKIRVVLDEILFVQTSNAYNVTQATAVARQQYAEEMHNRVNIHIFPMNVVTNAWGYASSTSLNIVTSDDPHNTGYGCIPTSTNDNCPVSEAVFGSQNYRDWSLAHHLKHELGHIIGLCHVNPIQNNCTESLNTNNPDFLSDIFDAPWCSPSPCYPGIVGDPFLSDNDGITNNIMASNAQHYMSPMQAGRSHRAISLNNVSKATTGYSETPLVVSTSETWDFRMKVYSDIVINPGVILTIKCRLTMVQQARIIVKPGGQLYIEGGIITADDGPSNGTWGGVYLEGDNNTAQSLNTQGTLRVLNGAIEHARDAVTTIGIDQSGNWQWGTQGGIVLLNGAEFRNNRRDIQYLPHKFSNDNNYGYYSNLVNSTFRKTDDYRHDAMISAVSMYECIGIDFEGCEFLNENTGDYINYAQAIFAQNSIFSINEGGLPFQRSKVEGFAEGIRSENYSLESLSDDIVNVKNTDFKNNLHGVYVSGLVAGVHIVDNHIDVPNSYIAFPGGQPPVAQTARYGVYVDQCGKFDVRQNSFKATVESGTELSVGLIVANSGPVVNRVYANEFDNFDYGIQAIGDNMNGADNSKPGLYFQCNHFGYTNQWGTTYGEDVDIHVDAVVLTQNTGVSMLQGYDQSTVATLPHNTFDNVYSGSTQISNLSKSFVIYSYEASTPLVDPTYVTIDVIKNITNNTVGYDPTTYCGDEPESESYDLPTLGNEITSMESQLSSNNSLRTQFINGGNTAALEAEVLFADDQQEYQDLYISLMDASPYVEDYLLMELLEKPDFPELALRNVFVANPHGARNPEIWEALVNRDPALSQQTLDDIENETQTISAFDVLQAEISYTIGSLDQAKDDYISGCLASIETEKSNLLSFLSSESMPSYQYLLAEIHLAEGELTNAQSVLNNIPVNYSLNSYETSIYNSTVAFYDVIIAAKENGTPMHSLSAASLTALEDVYNSGTGASVQKAKALLHLNGVNTDYIEPVMTGAGSFKMSAESANINSDRPLVPSVSAEVYPNPSNGVVTLEWNPIDLMTAESVTVEVVSITGQIVHTEVIKDVSRSFSVIDLNEQPAGVYVIKMRNDETTLYSGNIILQ
ncbi:T9SS type A sorting domain-containing protein [Phaeocystidibacter marisrubri]|uniref:T9SS type A sorting domain-containing protein n=1 Tax=Phaeocystidibacter marisrubri TaxID=1577780 RepID=A0A6L3ZF74_9FLAO|nr:T9SS type A sorting domain-containing protein [Phaeocystidibacter marisrubri]KAB2815529.1 T9SS type A sorting domain-containing protein [Phaeocystidibacter marisrubri]GGH64367.1 hypothetical protein GCM10011318_00320 [Phaeocystidibacter marisrubri]